MKPELVSEERLRELCRAVCEKVVREECGPGKCKEGCFHYDLMAAMARAALEEVGVVRVEEMDLQHYQADLSEHPLIPIEWLMEGAVLVRAKPRPDCARKGRGE